MHEPDHEVFALGVASALNSAGFRTTLVMRAKQAGDEPDLWICGGARPLASCRHASPVISIVSTAERAREELARGAAGVLVRDYPLEGILQAVELVRSGYVAVPAELAPQIARRLATPPEMSKEDMNLLRLLTFLEMDALSEELGYSRRHTYRLVSQLCRRFGFGSRLEAIVAAVQWGLAELDST